MEVPGASKVLTLLELGTVDSDLARDLFFLWVSLLGEVVAYFLDDLED